MKRQRYQAPETERVFLQIDNSILTGSTEGGGGNEEYIPSFMDPPFEIPSLPSIPGIPGLF